MRVQLHKLILSSVLLILIDRIEFLHYAFKGSDVMVPFAWGYEPIKITWYVYLISQFFQQFLFSLLVYLWIPMKREMLFVVIAFGLCIIEFTITYGKPIAKIPLPFDWYVPVSCSSVRMISICYFMYSISRWTNSKLR